MKAPVVLFAYNRPVHTKKTLDSLFQCAGIEETDVYIYVDGAKHPSDDVSVNQVKEVVRHFESEKKSNKYEVIESKPNKGLSNSVISGVSEIMSQYGCAIVLEDDMLIADDFLQYMNGALEYYHSDSRIWGICGYSGQMKALENYPEDVYFACRMSSWGWASWQNRWEDTDWEIRDYPEFRRNLSARRAFNKGGNDMSQMLDRQMAGKIDSWAIRFCYNQFCHHAYAVYPSRTLIQNIGQDGSGTHCETEMEKSAVDGWNCSKKDWNFIPCQENRQIAAAFAKRRKISSLALMKSYMTYQVFHR